MKLLGPNSALRMTFFTSIVNILMKPEKSIFVDFHSKVMPDGFERKISIKICAVIMLVIKIAHKHNFRISLFENLTFKTVGFCNQKLSFCE